MQVAGGEIVDAGVAENVGANVVALGELAAAAGDDDSQFALVIGAFGNLGAKNGCAGRQQGRRRLEKYERLQRNVVAEFGGMFAIVAADADNFRRLDRRQQRCLRERNVVHAAAGQAFHVAIARLRRLEQEASDFVVTRNRLDQTVVRGTVEMEATVFHLRDI